MSAYSIAQRQHHSRFVVRDGHNERRQSVSRPWRWGRKGGGHGQMAHQNEWALASSPRSARATREASEISTILTILSGKCLRKNGNRQRQVCRINLPFESLGQFSLPGLRTEIDFSSNSGL